MIGDINGADILTPSPSSTNITHDLILSIKTMFTDRQFVPEEITRTLAPVQRWKLEFSGMKRLSNTKLCMALLYTGWGRWFNYCQGLQYPNLQVFFVQVDV